MLERVNLQKVSLKEEYKKEIDTLEDALYALQQKIKTAGLPVLILFDGWGAAGKGKVIGDLLLAMDPRGVKTYSFEAAERSEKQRPFLWRYWNKLPQKGQIVIMDRSWYQEIAIAELEEKIGKKESIRRMESANTMERQLVDGGYLILKFFLHISQKEQAKRFEKLGGNKNTAWRVTEKDWKRNRKYDDYYEAFDRMLERTDTPWAPWHALSSENSDEAMTEVFRTIIDQVNALLSGSEKKSLPAPKENFPLVEMPALAEVRTDKSLLEDAYKEQLKECRGKLSKLHNRLYLADRPVIIVYEGWDAAGKGGNIRHVASALDPRGYEVNPIAAPSAYELAHHYLWRFWTTLPKEGHIAIYDRSWYGRVMVERIEGFCSEEEWKRAYREINEFERELFDWGAIVVKFWINVAKEEQLRRFQARQNNPEKQWKITAEDWRNRDKWDQYEVAVNEMLSRTSTEYAPWEILEGDDKKFARVKALKTLIERIEARL